MPIVSTSRINLYIERSKLENSQSEGGCDRSQRVLFISGTGGDLRVKPNVMGGPLASQFDLLSYDQRGLGQSDIPEGPYEMKDYADDAAALMDSVGWEKASVVGVSFGGMVAQHLAIRHPQKIERLVLACTSSGGRGGASYPFHQLPDDISGEAYYRKMIPIMDNRCDAAWQRENPEKFEKMINQSLSMRSHIPVTEDSERGAKLQLDARSRHNTFEYLSEIDCPVYLCGGRFDDICPPENMQALHEQIAGSTLALFEGGHLFMVQDKSALSSMAEFLSQVSEISSAHEG